MYLHIFDRSDDSSIEYAEGVIAKAEAANDIPMGRKDIVLVNGLPEGQEYCIYASTQAGVLVGDQEAWDLLPAHMRQKALEVADRLWKMSENSRAAGFYLMEVGRRIHLGTVLPDAQDYTTAPAFVDDNVLEDLISEIISLLDNHPTIGPAIKAAMFQANQDAYCDYLDTNYSGARVGDLPAIWLYEWLVEQPRITGYLRKEEK